MCKCNVFIEPAKIVHFHPWGAGGGGGLNILSPLLTCLAYLKDHHNSCLDECPVRIQFHPACNNRRSLILVCPLNV